MVKMMTPSDSGLNIVNYTTGNGAYTTAVKVAALLGIADLTLIPPLLYPKLEI